MVNDSVEIKKKLETVYFQQLYKYEQAENKLKLVENPH